MRMEITEALRREILHVYKSEGPSVASAFCVKVGLCKHYYSALAHRRGLTVIKSKRLTAEQKSAMRSVVQMDDSADPRWAWAINRGQVSAP